MAERTIELSPDTPSTPEGVLDAGSASELITLLSRGVRARQTYNTNNPVYQKFLGALRAAFAEVFERVPHLRVIVEERGFRVGHAEIPSGTGRDGLAFFFYKDGIRRLDFFPGFEDEVEAFLDLLHQARQVGPEGEDLVSILWGHEFEAFQYGYVDLLAEGVVLPDPARTEPPPLPGGILAAEVGVGTAHGESGGAQDQAAISPTGLLQADEFRETLYFLDDAELETLQAELEREWSRDLRLDVLNALFDRLEDGSPERQVTILEILGQLLPSFIARGHLGAAAALLRELDGILARQGILAEEARGEAARLEERLNSPETIEQLVQALEDGAFDPSSSDLTVFLSHLGAPALPALLRTAVLTEDQDVRDRLEPALDGLGARHRGELLTLLGSTDDAIAFGAARVAGRLRIPEAVGPLTGLLSRKSAEARLVAVEALIEIRSAPALSALLGVLGDPAREVRIAAARGLGMLRYQPAVQRLEAILDGRALRDADLTEKLIFFEAYATLAGASAVPLLERLLTGRGLLGRRYSPDIRACAATALGRIGAPAARAVLEKVRDETDPVVRHAVQRALNRELSEL